jgi:hypothetical protein
LVPLPTSKEDAWKESVMLHIRNVGRMMSLFCEGLMDRAYVHDKSKMADPEAEIFAIYTPKLKEVEFMSEEYKQNLAEMKPALDHHYANNRHHPQHFSHGIDGMNLIDLMEMFGDWYAASMRQKNGDPKAGIIANAPRFNMDPQLRNIFLNTLPLVEEHGYTDKFEHEED